MAEPENQPRRLRLISGTAEEVEWQLNQLLDEYTVTTWAFTPCGGKVMVTAILIHQRERRKMALATVQAPHRMH